MKDSIFQKIADERHKKGWSQVDLAKEIGMSRLMVLKFEQGMIPSPAATEKLAAKLGIPLELLKALREEAISKKPVRKKSEPTPETRVFRKKLLKAAAFSGADQLCVELVIDNILAKNTANAKLKNAHEAIT